MFERPDTTEAIAAVAAPVTLVADLPLLALAAGGDDEEPKPVSIAEAWERVRRRLRAELGEDVFSSWFARVEIGVIVDGVAYLTVPTRFLKSWLEAHYSERLRLNCMAELPGLNGIVLSVRQVAREAAPAQLREAAAPQRQRPAQTDSTAAPAAQPTGNRTGRRRRRARSPSMPAARCSTGA